MRMLLILSLAFVVGCGHPMNEPIDESSAALLAENIRKCPDLADFIKQQNMLADGHIDQWEDMRCWNFYQKRMGQQIVRNAMGH